MGKQPGQNPTALSPTQPTRKPSVWEMMFNSALRKTGHQVQPKPSPLVQAPAQRQPVAPTTPGFYGF